MKDGPELCSLPGAECLTFQPLVRGRNKLREILESDKSLEDKIANILKQRSISYENKHRAVRRLVEDGADPTTRNHVVLRWAAEHGYFDLVQLALERGCDIHCLNDEALIRAAGEGHLEVVTYLLDQGADIHAREDAALRNSGHFARHRMVELLLQRGADATAKNNHLVKQAFKDHLDNLLEIIFEHASEAIVEAADRAQDEALFRQLLAYMEREPLEPLGGPPSKREAPRAS